MQSRSRELTSTAFYRARRQLPLLFAILLASCGGGGGGGTGTPSMPAPSGLSYPAPPAFIVDRSIAPLTPTVTGQVATYSVSPAFPAGLALNATTGVISGTPTANAALASYTVTATNASGSTAASISILVNNDAAPSIQYGSSHFAFTASFAGKTPAPAQSGGNIVSWSVAPDLPAGLELSQADGSIGGTPAAASSAATYTVTAANSGGQSSASLTIAVGAPPLLDLGHVASIDVLRFVNSRVLSRDSNGHWLLQDFTSGTMLARGDSPCIPPASVSCVLEPVDLAGSVLIDATTSGLEVRDSSDGHLLTTLAAQAAWWLLASDGSYVCAGSATGLMAWSPSGQVLLSHSGDYSKAVAFAAPGQINVALGAAGSNVIESVSLASGTASLTAAFQGEFSSWFADGGRFLTVQGDTVRTYSAAGAQQDLTQLPLTVAPPAPSLTLAGGAGNWFWTIDGLSNLKLYQVGSSSSPALTASLAATKAVVSGTTLGVIPYGNSGQVEVIDLSGARPVSTTYTAPIGFLSSYAAISGTAWLVGNYAGVLLDGQSLATQPRYLTEGSATVTGGTQYFGIATAAGKVRLYEAGSHDLLGTVDFPAFQLSASSDGTVLAAIAGASGGNSVPGGTVNVYSLPSGTLLNRFPPAAGQSPLGIAVSGSGTVLAEVLPTTSAACYGQAITVAGGTPLWCAHSAVATLQVSPDGTLVAAAPSQFQTGANTTSIYKNGALVATLPGATPLGWLDNTRFLAAVFEQVPQAGGGTTDVYQSAVIYDSLGNTVSTPAIPDIEAAQAVTTDTLYSPDRNAILSLATGAVSWMSADSNGGPCYNSYFFGASLACFGALAGSEVIFQSGTSVLAQPL